VEKEEAKRDVASLRGLRFPWPKVMAASITRRKVSLDETKNKAIEEILTSPCLQQDTINIDRWEEEGGACSSWRGDPAKRTAFALLQNIKR
jgi:hypothetical protein